MPSPDLPPSPAISLLVANYNNSGYLAQCIQSVVAQSSEDWEIVIVDDGSTDDFISAIIPFSDDPRINVYYNDSNQGCSFTKRKLAMLGTGTLMAYLDPDDALMPGALETMIRAHTAHPECSLVHSSHMICDQNLVPLRRAEYPRALPPGVPYLLLSDGSVHAFATFKRSNYLATEGLKPNRKFDKAIDQELYYLLEETGPFFFIDHPFYYYRIHDGSISNMGHEYEATNVHYEIVLNRCRQRLIQLKHGSDKDKKVWMKKYRTRFHRVRVILSLRKRNYLNLLSSILQYPFVGGANHLFGYLRRFLKHGNAITNKTVSNYKIIVEKPDVLV